MESLQQCLFHGRLSNFGRVSRSGVEGASDRTLLCAPVLAATTRSGCSHRLAAVAPDAAQTPPALLAKRRPSCEQGARIAGPGRSGGCAALSSVKEGALSHHHFGVEQA